MKKAAILYVLFILLVSSAGAQSINIIEIDDKGNALWTIEKRIPITTQKELNEWELAIEKGQDLFRYAKDIQEVKDRINLSIASAQNHTNRSMWIENYNVTYNMTKTISDTLGIIHFSFEWNNFSRINSSTIFIGDSFSEGVVLSSHDILVIRIPDGYEIENVSPKYDRHDGNKLVWDGDMIHDFEKGEPSIVLTPARPFPGAWIFGLGIVMLISGALIFLWITRRRLKSCTDVSEDAVVSQYPELLSTYLEDEEMIRQILLKYNGQALQSDIVRESGFSKSKISNVLKDMKEQGMILKIRKGRGNIIRLTGTLSDQPGAEKK